MLALLKDPSKGRIADKARLLALVAVVGEGGAPTKVTPPPLNLLIPLLFPTYLLVSLLTDFPLSLTYIPPPSPPLC